MEFRQIGRCAYRTATRSSPLLTGNVQSLQPRPGPPRSLIPPSARLVSSSPGPRAPPRPRDGHASPARKAATPPRPPAVKSPWASREAREAREAREEPGPAKPDTLLQDAAELPGLIRWDVNAFLQRNQMRSGPPQEMRLRPSTGRTVYRTGSVDVARAFQMLNRMVRGNKVKQDLQRQRYHERPGLKRKRLKSERWKKRFAHGFRAVVNRVVELRNQGW